MGVHAKWARWLLIEGQDNDETSDDAMTSPRGNSYDKQDTLEARL